MMIVQRFTWCWRPARDWCARRLVRAVPRGPSGCVCDSRGLMHGAAVARAIGGEARPAM
jgi:hypothetical protein